MKAIRNFVRAFLRNVDRPVRHAGHDLAKNVRDAAGPVGRAATGVGSSEAVVNQAAKGKQRK